ncbi:TRAP transporter small permease [Desulfofundulus salinus]|uniref:TRAP transporter small permease n=1 Tax=Desulfofundulus salinus TaxID=2419843 RepID=A0A494WT56_9FIRM|nr:TRAP transporter small permease [Desulfofundulus salinum]
MGLLEKQVMQKRAVAGLPGKVEALDRLNSLSLVLNQGLAWVAGGSLLLMVLVVVGNALLRVVYAPFSGTTEIVGWLAAVTGAFGLGYTQVNRGYVELDALVERLSPGLQKAIKRLMLFISMIFFALVAWQITVYGLNVAKNGNLSETMGIPFYPLIFLVSLGFVGLTLAIFVDFLKEFNGGATR